MKKKKTRHVTSIFKGKQKYPHAVCCESDLRTRGLGWEDTTSVDREIGGWMSRLLARQSRVSEGPREAHTDILREQERHIQTY